MGFVARSDTGGIAIDATLTDIGREKLANGNFKVVSYAFSDDEIDYSRFDPTTGSAQQDRNILNTPVFESVVSEKLNFEYPLMIITNPNLKYLPNLKSDKSSISIGEEKGLSSGVTLRFLQDTSKSARIVPVEIQDSAFKVEMNNDLLLVEDEVPVEVSSLGTAIYILPRDAQLIQSTQGSQITFKARPQSINDSTWDTLGTSGSAGADRTIDTKVKATGLNSGLSAEITVTIEEEFNR